MIWTLTTKTTRKKNRIFKKIEQMGQIAKNNNVLLKTYVSSHSLLKLEYTFD